MHWIERLNSLAGPLDLGGARLEVLHWAHAEHLRDNAPHRHTYFEACLVGAHGRGDFIVQHEPYPVQTSDLFLARPGVLHQIRNASRPNMELFWVSFTIAPGRTSRASETHNEIQTLLRDFSHSRELVWRDDGQIAMLWRALQSVAATAGKGGSHAQIMHLMAAVLLAIVQAAVESTPALAQTGAASGDNLARWAVRYIHDNLDRQLTVPQIADYVHVSSRHLSRLIGDFTGKPPAAYIEHARMDRARALLRSGELPIKAVALEVGYADVQHFTRVFVRHHRIAPGAFRKRGTYSAEIKKPGALV